MEYGADAGRDARRSARAFQALAEGDGALWSGKTRAQSSAVDRCLEVNAEFLATLPVAGLCGADLDLEDGRITVPKGHIVEERNSSKARSTLKMFARDWSAEGIEERRDSYAPLIGALQRYVPVGGGGRGPRVLCPGCGMGRLPFDVARLGYVAQGNEFSYHMLMGSYWVLSRSWASECQSIYPYVLSTANRRGSGDHLREVRVPDVCPREVMRPGGNLSMAAGEFVEVYGRQHGAWDAVLTPFFFDTAHNVFQYIRVLADILRPGGVWANIGPLLFHYAESEGEVSVELSWEEIRPVVSRYFDLRVVEEGRRSARYTSSPGLTSGVLYRCLFFVAVRNGVPTRGCSKPVF